MLLWAKKEARAKESSLDDQMINLDKVNVRVAPMI